MNINRNFFSSFTKQYQVQKTVRFALEPIGSTEKRLIDNQIVEAARRKDSAYKIVKPIIDQKFRSYIDKVLQDCETMDWNELESVYIEYKNDNTEKNEGLLKKSQDKIRKKISKAFENNAEYKDLFDVNLFKTRLPQYVLDMNLDQESKEAVEEFQKFKTYFDNFLNVRKSIFSSDEKSNTIPYRIVNQNFMVFINNRIACKIIEEQIDRDLVEITRRYKNDDQWTYYEIGNLKEWFETNNYQRCLSQWGIERYNYAIGIVNLYTNEFLQKSKIDLKRNKVLLRPLYKQILSDRDMPSWLPEQFADGEEGEKQLFTALKAMEEQLKQEKILARVSALFKNISADNDQIYIAHSDLPSVSMLLQMKWDGLEQMIQKVLVGENKNITEKRKKEIEKQLKKDKSLLELSDYLYTYSMNEPDTNIPRLDAIFEHSIELCQDYEVKRDELHKAIALGRGKLNENEKLIVTLKDYLDAVQSILHYLKMFIVSDELEKDAVFYSELDYLYEQINIVVPLYNKVRSYVTRKTYSVDKLRIMFERSDFLGGWGQDFGTKEALLFQKDNLYYIGVIESKYSEEEVNYLYDGIDKNNSAIHYEYNFQKMDNKNIPRLFIRSKGDNYAPAVRQYQLPVEDIIDIYDKGMFKTEYKKKNEKEYYESLEKLIDYFKLGFSRNEAFHKFQFKWKPSNEYENIAEFYRDTNNACFYLEKREINFEHLLEQVEQGKMYLFQISSKDFKTDSKGTPNLQTIYWRELFSDENIKNGVIKLSGNASIYMRDASIQKPVIHKQGSVLVNRWYEKDGQLKPIDNTTYVKYLKLANGTLSEDTLDDIELELWKSGLVQTKVATHDITKDKRYTKKQYMLHAPLVLNYKQPEKPYYFNDKVRAFLKNNPDVNIIGIDRGEKNLIYVTVIDQKGNIIEGTQKSFNQVEQKLKQGNRQVDYMDKLNSVEKKHDSARKSWMQIGTIKELKEGYLSQVVHEITEMMIQYNAIIVMENLNQGFKRGRMKVEKSVYQKFEKMLIDKLNFLAFKRDLEGNMLDTHEIGGVMNAYQLADQFTSFSDIGMQMGFIFYVPAAYTSKIDPVTGFANLFQQDDTKTVEKRLAFLKRFDDFSWDNEEKTFKVSFDYDNFKCVATSYQKKWCMYANVERYRKSKENSYKPQKYIPNDELIKHFNKMGIQYLDGHNLIHDIESFDKNTIFTMVYCIKLMLQLRNNKFDKDGKEIDYISSPIKCNGKFFVSGEDEKLPKDSDANGAYHIAMKGLLALNKLNKLADEDGKISYKDWKITHAEWFEFMQTRNK